MDGRPGTPQGLTLPALGYGALRAQPVRRVAGREPRGRRRDEAFCGTALPVEAACVRTTSARRGTRAVACHDATPPRGFGQAQRQAPQAVQRTAPCAGLGYRLVLLWAAPPARRGGTRGWLVHPGDRATAAPAFPDLLTALQPDPWRARLAAAPSAPRRRSNPAARQLPLKLHAA